MSTPPDSRRVVITGLGLISPSGSTPTELWANLSAGRSGVGRSTFTPQDAGSMPIAAEARQFTGAIDDFGELESGVKKSIRKALKLMCRETQMAVAAAQLALSHAGFDPTANDPEASGVVLGSDYMLTIPEDYIRAVSKCAADTRFEYAKWGDEGLEEIEPLWMLRYLPNMPASHVAILNDFRGPNNSLTMREAAGLMAVGEAYRIIARGHADRMLAGATGTRLMPMQAIHTMQTVELAPPGDDPAAASRPFDRDRRGMVAGEGAGVILLESLESAEARGATVYGEVIGYGAGLASDASLRGDWEAALRNAMRAAMADAAIAPNDVGHVNAHGDATRAGDAAEAQAIRSVLGDATAATPVVALKSYFGNLGAGGGVVELIGSLLALRNGELPTVLNFHTHDPGCPVSPVAERGVAPGRSFVSLNVTPQGQAAAVVVAAAG